MPEGKLCPNCGKPAAEQFKPFCSARCRDVDLHRWFSGTYAIPVKDDEDEDGEKPKETEPE